MSKLTPRELQVLTLMSKGLAFRRIACRLGISIHTVKQHSTQIYNKLEAVNGAHAVAIALTSGLLGGQPPGPVSGGESVTTWSQSFHENVTG